MDIYEFTSSFRNHPVLFVGTGVSLRYLEDSYTWDSLLRKIASEISDDEEYYLDIKAQSESNGRFHFDKIATQLEGDFNEAIKKDRHGKLKSVNDTFYEDMHAGEKLSRLKIYISQLLNKPTLKAGMTEELAALKKASKNIGSIITTNYDTLLEELFEFSPLIGNDILLSNPYGSVYKIHGCVTDASKIIITAEDYEAFSLRYELVRAQLLSLFIHNPIIFIGYSISDENIKSILKTIFTYVDPNSDEAKKVRHNFLLVEWEKESGSKEITEHDIDLEGLATIRINKIKTGNFTPIYEALSSLALPVTAMDVRKVQNIVHEIYAGGDIKVTITEDLENLKNGDKILAIGSSKTIQYQYFTVSEMMSNYFKIIEESNDRLLELLNKQKIQPSQFFPIFGFSTICDKITAAPELKEQQKAKIQAILDSIPERIKTDHTSIEAIISDQSIANSYKGSSIIWAIINNNIPLTDLEAYLKAHNNKPSTDYKKLLCVYDLIKYGKE